MNNKIKTFNRSDVKIKDKDGNIYCTPCEIEPKSCDKFEKPFDLSESFINNELKKLLSMKNFSYLKPIVSEIFIRKEMKQYLEDYKNNNVNLHKAELKSLLEENNPKLKGITRAGKIKNIMMKASE